MPDIIEQARLAIDADTAWRRIGDFAAVGDWHPMLAKVTSDGNAPGALRRVETTDGGKQVERLEAYDADRHVYHYTMQETQLPVADYAAEFRVDDDAAGGSTVTWLAHFEVTSGDETEGVEMIRQFIETGIDALAKRYG